MAIATTETLAALASPLPLLPAGELFTPEQWKTLLSICEVFVPSIPIDTREAKAAIAALKPYLPKNISDDVVKSYFEESCIADPRFKELIERKFKTSVPASGVKGFAGILYILNTTAGSFLLTGSTTLMHLQDLKTRTAIVSGWQNSYLPPLRSVHNAISGLTRAIWSQESTTMPKIIDFPATPISIKRNITYDFKFHEFSDPKVPTTLSTDVIIVGSGCGAGVVASRLSRAGHKVLILEKGYHFTSAHFPMKATDAWEHLYESGGFMMSDEETLAILAGSTWGGGGTVNWAASLQPQYFVRQEWAAEGMKHFIGPEFQSCLDEVCDRMGVVRDGDAAGLSKIDHNFGNKVLIEGSRRLGMTCKLVPQNTPNGSHDCGYCSYGCASCEKGGPASVWLPDAARHGAEAIEGCFVEEILFENHSNGTQKAAGVRATWTSQDRSIDRTITIKAKKIIISAGSLNSPLILTRSGLTNRHIGNNLHLHPTSLTAVTFPQRINPWDGAILTTAVSSLENLDGQGHGVKIENCFAHPSFGGLARAWRGSSTTKQSPFAAALDYKLASAKHGYSAVLFPIQRDKGTGRVFADPDHPRRRGIRISYTASALDRAHLTKGLIATCRIAYTMGALDIETGKPDILPFVRSTNATDETNDAAFELWLAAIEKRGITTSDLLGSAHQMGSCRMSARPDTGVVDSRGAVWGTEDLYVADASVFPSASGVNPMVTTMGIAEWIARGIEKEMKQ